MNIVDSVNSLGLPKGEYVVFGSGPMSQYKIRESEDIDLFVSNKLYQKLKADGWEEMGKLASNNLRLSKFNVEIFKSWNFGAYRPEFKKIIATAEYVDDVAFAPLSEVLKWKSAFGRPRDLDDIKLINRYLKV